MERLSALDAEFLLVEDGIAHMHIAGISVFEGPRPELAELKAMMAAKLHRIPRYRQRVRTVPFELGRPVWVDDPHFDLEYHIRHTALPSPGDDLALRRLMSRLMSQELDRERPLWEVWFVEGLEGDRWALISKVHHCMVDGVSGIDLLSVLLDVEPDAPLPEAPPWTPEAEPSGLVKVLDAWSAAWCSPCWPAPSVICSCTVGEDPDTTVLRTLVPVSVRTEDARGVPDNRVSAILFELPVHLADPVERVRAAHQQMVERKASHMSEAGEVVVRLGDLAPPMVVGAFMRTATRLMARVPQRSVNTVTTNVPGPQLPLFCLGRRMLAHLPFVPLSHGVRSGVAILSYDGNLAFGVTGDRDTAADVDVLAGAVPRGLGELQRQLAEAPVGVPVS